MRGLALVVLLGLALAAPRAAAQVELDGSIGPSSGPVSGGLLPDGITSTTFLIEEAHGARSGANLFHSFSRFSIPSAQSATFTGDPSIERVIGRVTGNLPSFIDGTLRNAIEGADLYLFNPRGFFFSGTASLDLRGSLYLSSANHLRFADDRVFSAVPIPGEVLSAEAPSAWGFTSASTPGSMSFARARDLRVPVGETVSVVGGPVIASGLASAPMLLAPGGTIAIASRLAPGEVPVGVAGLSARGAATGELGAINLGPNATLDVSDASDLSATRGRIVIRGDRLTVTGSTLRTGSAADAVDDAPDVDVETATSILLRSTSRVAVSAHGAARGGGLRLSSEEIGLEGLSVAESRASGTARGGRFDLSAGTLRLNLDSNLAARAADDATAAGFSLNAARIVLGDRARIGSFNASSMDAEEIAIDADSLELANGASVLSEASGSGAGARMLIDASLLEQASGARIESDSIGAGRGGDVEIHAETVELRGAAESADPGGVFARSLGSGAAGDIAIEAGDVRARGGAQISATAEAAGPGGNVEIDASRALELSGASLVGPTGVFARSGVASGTTASGAGGTIQIEAPVVVLTDGAEISAQTFGAGSAGGIRVVARERVSLAGTDLLTSSINAKARIGSGGNILIETAELVVENGGEVSASTLERGDSGDIEIEAERVYVGGGSEGDMARAGIFAQSIPGEFDGIEGGDGGDIDINASSVVDLRNGGLISVRTRGSGAAGSVRIVAPVVSVRDGAEISAQTGNVVDSSGSGEGGDIEVRATNLLEISNGGSISVTAIGTGNAGDIIVRDTKIVRVENGEISGRSERSGEAGSVTLDGVGDLTVGEGGSISTETLAEGRGGSISIGAESQVLVMNGGTISALSTGEGDAGSIAISAGQRFSARNGGQVTTSAVLADGGDITIGASRLIYIEDGKVTTDVRAGLGSGGNITLDPEFVVLNRAELRASATGDGGNITIQTDRFVRDASSVVDASSEFGVDGEIQTTSPTVDLTSELAQLDTSFLDASSKLAAACAARAGERGTFAVRGRARPASPDAPLGSASDEERAPGCDEPNPP